jgi:hypothetical protein
LFCILDGPARVAAVLDAVEAAPGVHVDSVLVFEGPEGAHALERGAIGHHPASLLRVAQRLLTGDGEYREAIAGDVASGAVALALHVPPDEVDAATAVLERVGARHLAYTAHWNFNDPHRAPRVA